MRACEGSAPSRRRVIRPMRAAPAVWEELGPTMTGPRISNRSIVPPEIIRE